MGLVHRFRSYLLEEDLEIRFHKGGLNIVNFNEIGHFDSYKVVVKSNSVNIYVEGQDLVVSKLLQDEILITGKITKIEFR